MRASDEKREQIVNRFLLDNFFKKYDPNAELVVDEQKQLLGADLIFKGLDVDIKAQTSYLNNPRDTYILEISTLNRWGHPIPGWFINPYNTTMYYCFVWIPNASVDNRGNLLKVNKAELLFVRKSALRNCIKLMASDDKLYRTSEMMRKTGTRHKILDRGIRYVMSDQLKEKPVALVIPKSLLHVISIKHCLVGEDSIVDIGVNVTKKMMCK